jgi:hypothetical protein
MSNEAVEATNVTSKQMKKILIQNANENLKRSSKELSSLAVSLEEASNDYKKKKSRTRRQKQGFTIANKHTVRTVRHIVK